MKTKEHILFPVMFTSQIIIVIIIIHYTFGTLFYSERSQETIGNFMVYFYAWVQFYFQECLDKFVTNRKFYTDSTY